MKFSTKWAHSFSFPNRRIMALDGNMDIELTEKETNILNVL